MHCRVWPDHEGDVVGVGPAAALHGDRHVRQRHSVVPHPHVGPGVPGEQGGGGWRRVQGGGGGCMVVQEGGGGCMVVQEGGGGWRSVHCSPAVHVDGRLVRHHCTDLAEVLLRQLAQLAWGGGAGGAGCADRKW